MILTYPNEHHLITLMYFGPKERLRLQHRKQLTRVHG